MSDTHDGSEVTSPRGRQIHDLFRRALELPGEARTQFLHDECDDSSLRNEVHGLLAQDAAADREGFLNLTPTLPGKDCEPSAQAHSLVGERIGACQICEWIATGGMGAVYRATRVDDYQHSVAIKLVRPGWDTPESLGRLANERQILAELNHPYIAQIFDGGTTDAGQPYFVMEYIDGKPVDIFCMEGNTPLRKRIELFVHVCRAVQHAHERGVIHRDVKPSNILVTRDGIPKLTDFGVALWTEGNTEQTQTGVIIGTPGYVSPEQAAGRRNEVGPLSDVFSLGAVMYKLLTDVPAFKADTWKETINQVCLRDPARPRLHRPDLPVDLESICMKCLEKEPGRRYESARAMADDLQRWLDGGEVRARPIGLLQKWGRWYRRDPWTAVTTTIAVVAVLGSLGTAILSARRARSQSELASSALVELGIVGEQLNASRDEVRAGTAQLEAHTEHSRRLKFNQRLARIHAVVDSHPDLAMEWLSDPVQCPVDLRQFAWKHLYRRASRHLMSIRCGKYHISAPVLGFLPGDAQLLSVTQKFLNIWDVSSGQHVKDRLGSGPGIEFLAKSPDGSVLAVPRHDGTMALFRTADAFAFVELTMPTDTRTCAAVTNDARHLAVGTMDGVIEFWDVPRSTLVNTWQAHEGRVIRLVFTMPGNELRSYGEDRKLQTWSLPAGRLASSHDVPIGRRRYPEFAPGGEQLAFGLQYGGIKIWDPQGATLLWEDLKNGSGIPKVAYSSDGRTFAASVNQKKPSEEYERIRVWGDASREVRLEWGVRRMKEMAFSNDGRLLATSSENEPDACIELWDVRPRTGVEQICPSLTAGVDRIAWVAEGHRLLCSSGSGQLSLIDVDCCERDEVFNYAAGVRALTTSMDGHLAAVAVEETVHVWTFGDADRDSSDPLVFEAGREANKSVLSVAFSPDGEVLAAGSRDGTIQIWRLFPAQLERQFVAPSAVWSMAFSADGRTLVSGEREGQVTVWNLPGQERVATRLAHVGGVTSLGILPSGTRLASAGYDGLIQRWKFPQLNPEVTLKGHAHRVIDLELSRNGSTMASVGLNAEIQLRDAATGGLQLVLNGHETPVIDLAFSLDGSTLATCDETGTILLWLTGDAG